MPDNLATGFINKLCYMSQKKLGLNVVRVTVFASCTRDYMYVYAFLTSKLALRISYARI